MSVLSQHTIKWRMMMAINWNLQRNRDSGCSDHNMPGPMLRQPRPSLRRSVRGHIRETLPVWPGQSVSTNVLCTDQARPGQARVGNSNGPAAGKHPAVRLHQETLLTLSGVSWQSWQSWQSSHSHL